MRSLTRSEIHQLLRLDIDGAEGRIIGCEARSVDIQVDAFA